ncbi:Aryl-alcohol dehydrogenase [Oceanobacillus picturae]|uniref:Aryl-alcohol dehydrogenase n=1 Tax=Oceanobacillus picturae TaxID=171693 RepID=W9BEP3_9BACI|nr:NAD(P)-dependent alcohol dehydrogenase [Oceanobacillus picturae]RIU93478.1 NAD(P)-dependent alcohol dehydrogenase [Oceanobacillus picturae]CDO04720.1 Aryl-alcohol dehydrogenase [Oceanobacillus picturae]
MKIKGAVVHGKGQEFQIEELELSEPKENEVLVKVVAAGVCHTDAVARDQMIPVQLPAVLGHEGSGIIEKVGAGVKTVEPGDHVVLSFSSCGNCENCLTGHPAACIHLTEFNFGGKMPDGTNRLYQGDQEVSTFFGQSTFGTYAVSHERNVVKVDKDVDLNLLGPLGCGIQTGAGTVINKLQPEFGSTIAIFGCGAVGLSAIMGAKLIGCSKIIAVDIHDSRLELAKELGATHVINGSEVETLEEIRKITDGGVNYAVETTGVSPVVVQSVQSLRSLGTVAVVGATGEVTLNVQLDLLNEGRSIVSVVEGDSIPQLFIPKLIEYYKNGQFPFDKLVKFYELEEINQAFEDSGKGTTIKPILKI